MPMLPMCNSQPMCMPMAPNVCSMPAMVPMVPMVNTPMLCPANMMNLCTTSTMTNEYDSRMYGRFRHVERENPRYRHAPFDWYRPPKQYHHVVHEDAAVVTLDGPVALGDFYRRYIYGEDDDEYDDDDDEYDDDQRSSSFETDGYGDEDDDGIEGGDPAYEARSTDYRRGPRRNPYLDDQSDDVGPAPSTRPGTYTTLNTTRRGGAPGITPSTPAYRGTRTLAGDDDFNDNASVNSTYGN